MSNITAANSRPSSRNLKWRVARKRAKSSLSNALYLLSDSRNLLLKKASGRQAPSDHCSTTAPTAQSDASVESRQSLPQFCFPYENQRPRDSVAVQHFTFALTDLDGCQRFGFCRLADSSRTCLCILSYLPWFEVFYKLLNNLADYLFKGQINELKALLGDLYRQPVPLVPGSVTLTMGEQVSVSTEVHLSVGHPGAPEGVPYFIAPDPRSLPSIPESRNLTELIVAVDVGNLLQLYASMLFERRILIFASKLSTLTSCVHALSAVLCPMNWQHIFIPVLPPHLLDYCCAPMPYLIGVHTSLAEKVRSRGLEEVVILDVDTNTLESPFNDFKKIPTDVMSQLKMSLKRQAVSRGSGVSRAFLRAQALLFGGYRQALCTQSGDLSFNKELFLGHKSWMKQFLQSAIHCQFFKQFIDSRLDVLNKGLEPNDLFEEEIENCEASPGKPRSYQQLAGNIKKGGGALILNVKSNMKAKGLTKSGLKHLLIHKSHTEEVSMQRGGSVSHRLEDRQTATQLLKYQVFRDEENIKDTNRTCNRLELEDDDPRTEEEELLLCDPEEMDLLGEIFDTLSSRSSHERGLLYATRSLDLFAADSHDFIAKRSFANPSEESLCSSLHSWHQETTDQLSDLTEDWDPLEKSKIKEKEETASMMRENQDLHISPQDLKKEKDNRGYLRFQSHAPIQGPDLKSRMKILEESGGHLHMKNNFTDTEEEKPPVNVSELKKRFETE
uniref:UDENN domain-containing protein n=1 Tax=Knipowitschia caucasica TaxID=637954 RepID=A0AAV2LMR8_KNICA